MNLLEPKEIEMEGKVFILSKFPAIAGREILVNWVGTGMPKIGDYKKNEEIMLKLMNYVAVETGDIKQRLSNQTMIDNHVKSWEILVKLELAMIEYNCSFFQNGLASNFLTGLAQKLPAWISKILMDLSQQSSPKKKRRITS